MFIRLIIIKAIVTGMATDIIGLDLVTIIINDCEVAIMHVLCIVRNNEIIAKGIYLPATVFLMQDSGGLTKSYSDMGVFVLLKGSKVISENNNFCEFICENKTKKNLIFQSRNSAAKFILGENGHTNDWK